MASYAEKGRQISLRRARQRGLPDVRAAAVIAFGLVPLRVAGRAEDMPPSAGREGQLDFLTTLLGDAAEVDAVRAHAPTALARLLDAPTSGDSTTMRDPRNNAVAVMLRIVQGNVRTPRSVLQSATLALGLLVDCSSPEKWPATFS